MPGRTDSQDSASVQRATSFDAPALTEKSPKTGNSSSGVLPTWKVPKATHSPETYVVVSSVVPSAILPNVGVSTWSKSTSPRFGKTSENTCKTQYDLARADKYLSTTRASVMLGAPRTELARRLDSHALGNVPNFLRQVRSYNVKGGVMCSGTSKTTLLPDIVRPRRTPQEVTEIIQRKRRERNAKKLEKAASSSSFSSNDEDTSPLQTNAERSLPSRRRSSSSSCGGEDYAGIAEHTKKRRNREYANIKPRYMGHKLPLKIRHAVARERKKYVFPGAF